MNSWDVFDTLIARRFFYPKTVHEETARRINDSNYVKKRIRAEKATKKDEGNFEDIYKLLPEYDPQVELQVELEHLFPIVENINKVKDGDLILSDMYLSADEIMKILRNCGLTKNVDIIVTRYGKRHGYIWDSVKQKYNIDTHYGDNNHSDVKTAQANGVNGVLDTLTHFTELEQMAYEVDPQLACWMRKTRLLCPHTGDAKKYWIEQANLNLPVLALATLELPDRDIAFTYRDCCNWQPLYEAMTGKKSKMLITSRKMYLEPNEHFKEYIDRTIDANTTIVDLQGEGNSIYKFYNQAPPHTIYIGGKTLPYVDRLVPFATKSLEKHNCYQFGPVIDWDEDGPIRGPNDHPQQIAKIQYNAMASAISICDLFKPKPNKELLLKFVERMHSKEYATTNIKWAKFNEQKK